MAIEAGNNANMVQRHYKLLVSEGEGRRWFDLVPPCETNIVPLPARATG